jgi:hypothetical protein
MVKKFLQEGEEDFAMTTKCYVKDWSFMIHTNDSYIDLPKDFIEIVGNVEFKTRTLNRISHFEDFSRYKTDGTIRTGDPEHYFIRGERMHLYPAMSTGDSALVTFSYAAKPQHLDDSATKYDFLRYDGLIADQFLVGDEILGLTSSATAKVADIREIAQKSGYLVLEITSGTFQDNEKIVVTSDEQGMWLNFYNNTWADLLTNWGSLGLKGQALVQGQKFDIDAGNSPLIPQVYHHYLICYAKSALSENANDYEAANMYRVRYLNDVDKARQQSQHKSIDGVQDVIDVFGNAYL